jgi:hypothetical protein
MTNDEYYDKRTHVGGACWIYRRHRLHFRENFEIFAQIVARETPLRFPKQAIKRGDAPTLTTAEASAVEG